MFWRLCRDELPNTAIHVLSNGRAFVRDEVVTAWAAIRHPNLTVGIPIYSAVDHVHDYVVQARGAFDETVLGILKLKDSGQRIEVRVVLHALTAPRIVETCRWLARNLPFVNHVALMGLENTGFAIANEDELWIDPIDYRAELAEGVNVLAQQMLTYRFTICSAAFLIARFGPMLCNRFLIGRTDTWRNATAASKKIDAAAFLPQVARAEVAALVQYLHLNWFMGASRFSRRAFPLPRHHVRTCKRRVFVSP